MKAMRVIESVEFQRGADPYTSLGIGKSTQRDFSGGKELIEWAYNFPAVWSKGEIPEWNDSDYIIRKPFGGYLEEVYIQRMRNIKLIVIKWIKDNITINGEPLSLKEAMNMFEEIQKFVIKNLERERGIRESIDFHKGGNPLDTLEVGRIEERKDAAYRSFMDWLSTYSFKEADVIEETYDQPYGFFGDDEKEALIFNGLTVDEVSKKTPEEMERYFKIVEEVFGLTFWAAEIAKLEYEEYKTMPEEDKEELEQKIEDDFGTYNFLEYLVKYFINKWPGKVKIKDPYESKKRKRS